MTFQSYNDANMLNPSISMPTSNKSVSSILCKSTNDQSIIARDYAQSEHVVVTGN